MKRIARFVLCVAWAAIVYAALSVSVVSAGSGPSPQPSPSENYSFPLEVTVGFPDEESVQLDMRHTMGVIVHNSKQSVIEFQGSIGLAGSVWSYSANPENAVTDVLDGQGASDAQIIRQFYRDADATTVYEWRASLDPGATAYFSARSEVVPAMDQYLDLTVVLDIPGTTNRYVHQARHPIVGPAIPIPSPSGS